MLKLAQRLRLDLADAPAGDRELLAHLLEHGVHADAAAHAQDALLARHGARRTRAFAVVNYEQAVEPFLKTDRLSDTERAMLMGGACAKAYRWSPKKG
jgi:hypothetical protein